MTLFSYLSVPIAAGKDIEVTDVWTEGTSWNQCSYYVDRIPTGSVWQIGGTVEHDGRTYNRLLVNEKETDMLLRLDGSMLYLSGMDSDREFVRYDFADWKLGKDIRIASPVWSEDGSDEVIVSGIRLQNGKTCTSPDNAWSGTLYNDSRLLGNVGYVNGRLLLQYGPALTSSDYTKTVQWIRDREGNLLFSNPDRPCVDMWIFSADNYIQFNVRPDGNGPLRRLDFYLDSGNGPVERTAADAAAVRWRNREFPFLPLSFRRAPSDKPASSYDYSCFRFLPDERMTKYFDGVDGLAESAPVTGYDFSLHDGESYSTVVFVGTKENPRYVNAEVIVRRAQPLVISNVEWRRYHPEIYAILDSEYPVPVLLPGPEYIVEGIGPTDRGFLGWIDCSEETPDGPASGIRTGFNNLFGYDRDGNIDARYMVPGGNSAGDQMREDRRWEYFLTSSDGAYNEIFSMRFTREPLSAYPDFDEVARMEVTGRTAWDDGNDIIEPDGRNPYAGRTYLLGRKGNEIHFFAEDEGESHPIYTFPTKTGYSVPQNFSLAWPSAEGFRMYDIDFEGNTWDVVDGISVCGVRGQIADSGKKISYMQGIGVITGGIYPLPGCDDAETATVLNNVYGEDGVIYSGLDRHAPVPDYVGTISDADASDSKYFNLLGMPVGTPCKGDVLIRRDGGKARIVVF